MEQIYTPDEAAKVLKLVPSTVRKYCRSGELKAAKVGRVFRIRETDLKDFIERQTHPGQN